MKKIANSARQRFLPTLLDRLLDDAPHQKFDKLEEYSANGRRMREIVQRDLTMLLNTTNLSKDINAEKYPEIISSVLNYGVAALSGTYMADRSWTYVEKTVREAILRFEPRLVPEALMISPMDDNSSDHNNYNILTFEIQGKVNLLPYPLEFRVQSSYDLETGLVNLHPA